MIYRQCQKKTCFKKSVLRFTLFRENYLAYHRLTYWQCGYWDIQKERYTGIELRPPQCRTAVRLPTSAPCLSQEVGPMCQWPSMGAATVHGGLWPRIYYFRIVNQDISPQCSVDTGFVTRWCLMCDAGRGGGRGLARPEKRHDHHHNRRLVNRRPDYVKRECHV